MAQTSTWIWALAACSGPESDGASGSPSLWVDGALAFEDVEIGSDEPRVETLWVENVGTGLLFVDVPYFAEDGAFSVAAASVSLERMEAYGYEVTFDPQVPFVHEGSLVFESDDPKGRLRAVDVRGEGFAPVLEVSTSPLDFETTEVSCAAQEEIEVWNGGNAPLVVEPSLAGSSEIEIVSLTSFTIEPSTSAPIVLTYRPGDVAVDTAVLTVESNDPVHPPVAVDLTGMGRARETRTDVFEIKRPASDIVLVVDNSDSMDTEQTQLHDQIGAFVEELDDAGVDYRIGVITTDSSEFDGPVVVPGDALDVLADQVVVGTGGSGTQRALEMLYDCVHVGSDCSPTEGFLRDDALFVGIIVSDQPDQSALTPEAYVDYFYAVKGEDLLRIHAIAGAIPVPTCGTCSSAGFGYDEAVELTAGVFLDICADDWSRTMRALAEASHLGPPSRVGLSGNPVDHSIEVSVDGAPWEGGWTYTGRIVDGGTNEVVFADPLPAPSVLEVRYTVTSKCE